MASSEASNQYLNFYRGFYLEHRDGSFLAPFLPYSTTGGHFIGVPPGGWFDPPIASGFDFTTTDGALFTKILDFPPGFSDPFTISVGGTVLGQYLPGQQVDFTSFPGGGISSFRVSGINPLADPDNPLSFPIQLDFNREAASFDMIAIPEPSNVILAALGFIGLAALGWRRRKRSHA